MEMLSVTILIFPGVVVEQISLRQEATLLNK